MKTEPPPIAGRYEPRELIGRGGMGEVFLAWDRVLRREVALKRLRDDLAHDPTMRRRVEQEARAAAQLSHPNVVSVFDSGIDDDGPFIVMERLEGTTLADDLRAGPMLPDDARRMAGQVLRGLQAAHDRGLIHRDVKPGNILAGPDGSWKVADFGIVKQAEPAVSLTATNEVLGSAAYLAPERVDGGAATTRSDLYAVGVVLYEALAGCKPFDEPNAVALAMRVREGTHEPVERARPGVDPALAAVIGRAMAADPADRFATAGEMAESIEGGHVGRAETTTARLLPTSEHESTERLTPTTVATPAPARRLGIVLAAIVLALVAVLATAVIVASGRDETRPERPPAEPARNDDRLPGPLQDALDRLDEAVAP